ncbi:MAG TPA: peptidylprolyl isomerase [Azospirillaceae bacterium]|nr:peptidylprolyl isomerase [Azospirillaceae bacterium]
MRRLILAALALLAAGPAYAADPENILHLELTHGRVVIEMRPDVAPRHVARIKQLARQGFYDGSPFHRVIEGFMAQGGDPTGTGEGGSGKKLPLEPSPLSHTRGTVSMARADNPNTGDSQFFIMFDDKPQLDWNYTVWGKVVSGMEFVDRIKRGASELNGKVDEPDRIISVRVAADADKGPS